jgi:hypothetical protein
MPAPTPTELRAAALSDARRTRPTVSLLYMLLPDVPGEPYGGTTTPEQRAATASATGRKVPEPYSTGIPVRPVHLREILRRWAHEQPARPDYGNAAALQPVSERWEIRPYNTPNEHVWVILRDQQAVAEVYDLEDARFILAALQSRGSDNAAGLRTAVQTLATLDASGRPATPGTRPDSPDATQAER